MTNGSNDFSADTAVPFEKDDAFKKYFRIKRVFDLCFSLTGLIFAFIPMLIIAVLIKADSRGKIIFRQKRVGLNGKLFTCYKFRTMKKSAPGSCATGQLENAEDYITPTGRILRKTSLDEIPQLFNIIKGDMSIIGPRPLIPEETEIHEMRTKAGVYNLRPGLTGNAQINGRDLISADEKVRLDTEYLNNFSFKEDVRIFFRTFFNVLGEKDIHEGTV